MKLFSFIRGVFSETGGSPSASRVLMAWLSAVAAAVLVILAVAVFRGDVTKTAAICGSLPAIIAALSAFIVSPYAVNKFAKNPSDPPNQNKPS